MKEKHYIKFIEIPTHGKTKKYDIARVDDDDVIGQIYWSSGWRQYVWTSYTSIQWSAGCTQDVVDFIRLLMAERKDQHE